MLAISFVIVGHVDHGKSTLVGRLLHDTGSLPQSVMDKISDTTQMAHLVDHFHEEREEGRTIDTASKYFSAGFRDYVILDTPGHKELLKNMISGATLADAAFIIIDGYEGMREQSRRHAYLLSMLGIHQVVVLVNKMDLIGYSEMRFNEVKREIINYFEFLRFKPPVVIPISALTGENVVVRSTRIEWFKGPSMLELLESFEHISRDNLHFRFPIQDRYDSADGRRIYAGRLESGRIRAGEKVAILPGGGEAVVSAIRKFQVDNLPSAEYGECVAMELESGTELSRGTLLVGGDMPAVKNKVRGLVFWLSSTSGKSGDRILFKSTTQEIPGYISGITGQFDPGTEEAGLDDETHINEAHVANMELTLDRDAVFDPFNLIPTMGRFILEHEGSIAAAGIVGA